MIIMHALTIYKGFLSENLNIKLNTFTINVLVILIKEESSIYAFIFCSNESNPVNKEPEIQEHKPGLTCSGP